MQKILKRKEKRKKWKDMNEKYTNRMKEKRKKEMQR